MLISLNHIMISQQTHSLPSTNILNYFSSNTIPKQNKYKRVLILKLLTSKMKPLFSYPILLRATQPSFSQNKAQYSPLMIVLEIYKYKLKIKMVFLGEVSPLLKIIFMLSQRTRLL